MFTETLFPVHLKRNTVAYPGLKLEGEVYTGVL